MLNGTRHHISIYLEPFLHLLPADKGGWALMPVKREPDIGILVSMRVSARGVAQLGVSDGAFFGMFGNLELGFGNFFWIIVPMVWWGRTGYLN